MLGAKLPQGYSTRACPGPLTPRGAKEDQAKSQAEQQHCGSCEAENWVWLYGSPCPWAKVLCLRPGQLCELSPLPRSSQKGLWAKVLNLGLDLSDRAQV